MGRLEWRFAVALASRASVAGPGDDDDDDETPIGDPPDDDEGGDWDDEDDEDDDEDDEEPLQTSSLHRSMATTLASRHNVARAAHRSAFRAGIDPAWRSTATSVF